MPKPGPRPKPTKLKIVGGNPGKRPLNENEPKPPAAESIKAPKRFVGYERQEWNHIAPLLKEAGLLAKIDRPMLIMYCESYAIYRKALTKLKRQGDTVKTSNGNLIQSPHLTTVNKQREAMHKMLVEFGMSPSSRSRVQVTPPEGADAGAWAAFDH